MKNFVGVLTALVNGINGRSKSALKRIGEAKTRPQISDSREGQLLPAKNQTVALPPRNMKRQDMR
jgi:hypothetical protein